MGQKHTTANKPPKKEKEEINKNHFEFLYVVGKGGFGKVWKVEHKKFKKYYALKEMSKAKIIDKKSEKSIRYERDLLSKLKHPFIVNMYYSFQDYDNLYIVMDMLTGGDLRYHIFRHKKFSEEQTSKIKIDYALGFFIACIILGLEYIHENNILHRDIKPENLVLDERGYVRITDFGIAKVYQKENSSETSGTPGYMSPEVMCAQNHTHLVDYFAVGIIGYEFLSGKRPYVGNSRKEIKEQIMARQAQIKLSDKPDDWSAEAVDFINKCLQRKPSRRLGLNGIKELKEHPWLKYYPWHALYDKTLEAPFIPRSGDNFDKKYCEKIDKIGEDTQERYERYIRDENYKHIFRNFTYAINSPENDAKDENLNSLVGSKLSDVHLRNAMNIKHNINKNVLNQLMGSKTKVLNFEENIYNYNNYVINNYQNQTGSGNYNSEKASTNSSSKQIMNTPSISKPEVINLTPSLHQKKFSSGNVNSMLGATYINNSNNSNNTNTHRFVINLSKDENNSKIIPKDNHNINDSSSNLVQAIKSRQIPMQRDRDRRSNSIFGVSLLNNKPSTASLPKNPTIKNMRVINNDVIGNSNSRCGSINKVDSINLNDRSPSKNLYNVDSLKISRKLNGKSTSSISSIVSAKSPVYLYKNNSSLTNSSTGSSVGNSNSIKYQKQI